VNDPELLALLQQSKKSNSDVVFHDYPELYEELKQCKIIVNSDEAEILKIKHRVLLNRYSLNTIVLTLLPTLDCNFKCPYCFAGTKNGKYMTPAIISKIVKLVEALSANNKQTRINLSWMGGEPLLNFKAIKDFSRILAEKDNFEFSANLVTNGYLMTKEKIDLFPELKIHRTQVTIDGLEEEHNLTRIHKQGKNSFQKIIRNLDSFFSVYNQKKSPALNIRVNLAKNSNYMEKFIKVHDFMRNRYPYDNLYISPGFIEDIKANSKNAVCEFDRNSVKEFFFMSRKAGVFFPIYPHNQLYECAVRSVVDFVIGPQGELYSCWENIGFDEYVVGNLEKDGKPNITNELLYLRYIMDADYLNDPTCLDCFYFPICQGGCIEKRLRNKHCNACFDVCAMQKGNMEEILDFHYEAKQNMLRT
jgi:uncharacterized protein